VVRHTEIAETLNNRHMEIVETSNNRQTEEDLIIYEAIKTVIKETLDAEANPSYGETVIEAKRSVMNELSPVLWLDKPEPEELLKNYILEHYHGYLDMFTEKEAIPLLPHQSWDHVVTLIPNAPLLFSAESTLCPVERKSSKQSTLKNRKMPASSKN